MKFTSVVIFLGLATSVVYANDYYELEARAAKKGRSGGSGGDDNASVCTLPSRLFFSLSDTVIK